MALSKVPVVAGTKTLTRGSIVSGNASGEPAALAIGSNGQVLKSDGTDAVWGTDAGGAALTGSTNNTVTTVTGANAIQGEANLTFDGTVLKNASGILRLQNATTGSADTDGLLIEASGNEVYINNKENANSSFRPIRYKSNVADDDPNEEFIGFIADEFHNAGLTELVSYSVSYAEDDIKKENPIYEVEGFNYDRLTAILTKSLQNSQTKITALETNVADLTTRLEALENA